MPDQQWIAVGEELFARAVSPKNYIRFIEENGEAFIELKIKLKSRNIIPANSGSPEEKDHQLRFRSTSDSGLSIFNDDADISIVRLGTLPTDLPCRITIQAKVSPKVPHTGGQLKGERDEPQGPSAS